MKKKVYEIWVGQNIEDFIYSNKQHLQVFGWFTKGKLSCWGDTSRPPQKIRVIIEEIKDKKK